MIRGGGSLGRTVRAFEQIDRSNKRAAHAERTAPYQNAIAQIEERIHLVEKALLTMEHRLIEIERDGDG